MGGSLLPIYLPRIGEDWSLLDWRFPFFSLRGCTPEDQGLSSFFKFNIMTFAGDAEVEQNREMLDKDGANQPVIIDCVVRCEPAGAMILDMLYNSWQAYIGGCILEQKDTGRMCETTTKKRQGHT
jgi:hypothetical protein